MGFADAMMRNTSKHAHAAQRGKRRAALEAKMHIYEVKIQGSSSTWKPLMDSFDTDGTGTLDANQLKQILKLWNEGIDPSDEQVAFIISIADKSGQGSVNIDELGCAAGTWMALKDDQPFINETMAKYDTDKSGSLNKDQVKLMMTDLNDGIAPDDETVDLLISVADHSKTGEINRTEVRKAVQEWYGMAALMNDRKLKEKEAAERKAQPQGCCVAS
ncbi:hypothetical protein TrST_g12008 [Triparma strigata]|uniref:EF-hand domain-containing protein n=1 Tax=Triparma strigata TaxID=1606541 RepID=A0A9W7B8C1_9STRA|nr:hypothetical protein TrST_g12008 [Triparma strigata]